jgi:rRNA-processing protein FCF1
MSFDEVAARYRTAGLLIDTNVLLLYVVGSYDPGAIPRHKRTDRFVPADYALLLNVFDRFDRVVTTPHVLTETNSLAGQAPEHHKAGIMRAFKVVAARLSEEYTPARVLADNPSFTRFGIADCAVLHEARGRHLVLTDDFRLTQLLQHQGTDVINFNHLRIDNVRG